MSDTLCEGCGQHSFLLPLHGGKGGPLRCPLCVGAWNAEHGRNRRTGRIVIRAIMAFLDAGGSDKDIKKLTDSAMFANLGMIGEHNGITDKLGYMDGIALIDGADVDLTSGLLAPVLSLTHPDHHPPERKQLAHRVTQGLLRSSPAPKFHGCGWSISAADRLASAMTRSTASWRVCRTGIRPGPLNAPLPARRLRHTATSRRSTSARRPMTECLVQRPTPEQFAVPEATPAASGRK